MRVHLGSDHAGLELKDHLLTWLADSGYEVVDHGPFVYDAVDDYPVFCLRAAEGVAAERAEGLDSLGVVIGGSGNGEQMAANKVKGVRSALVWSEETAVLAREHNDANVVSVGGRMHSVEDMTRFVEVFLTTAFTNDERHVRRIGQVVTYETTAELPPLPASALQGTPTPESPDSPQGGTVPDSSQGGTVPDSPQGGTAPDSPQGGTAPDSPQGGPVPDSSQGGTAPDVPQSGTVDA